MKNLSLFTKMIITALMIFGVFLIQAAVSNTITNYTGLPFLAVFGVLLISAVIPVKNTRGALLVNALSVTQLVANLGAYYREFRDILISETLLGFDPSERFEVWDNVSDQVPMPNLSMTNIIKPYDDVNFTPTANAIAIGSRTLQVRNWKVDLLIQPRILEKTWLGSLKPPGSGHKNLIFEAYIFNYIISQIQSDLRLSSVFRGVYNAAGATPLDVMDGLLTLIAAEITALNITPVVTGAITSANVGAKILLTYDALGEAYKAMETQMIVNPTIFDWYTRQFAVVLNPAIVSTQNGPAGAQKLFNEFPISGTNCVLKREPGLGTSQRLICTPKTNLVYGTDSLSDQNNFDIQYFERSIKILIDAKSGVQLKQINSRALAVNDQP